MPALTICSWACDPHPSRASRDRIAAAGMNDEIAGMPTCNSDVLQQDGVDAWMKPVHIGGRSASLPLSVAWFPRAQSGFAGGGEPGSKNANAGIGDE
jgi:hypothetical protein